MSFIASAGSRPLPIATSVPTMVRTMWRRGKRRKSRATFVHKPDWKRAVVTLRAGDMIELI